MDNTTLAFVIAIVAGWISLNGTLCIVYLLVSKNLLPHLGPRRKAYKPQHTSKEAPLEAPVLVDENAEAWGLYVIFDNPSPTLNQRLGSVLAAAGAVFESQTRSFSVVGDSPRNPIYIANAYPPGALPSFNDGDGNLPIKGVSLKIPKQHRSATPNKLQLVRLISLTKEFVRLGGKAVDAAKHPVTEKGFEEVIAGKAKV